MIFAQIATGGCQSYLVGCPETCAGAIIDPELQQFDRYRALATREGIRVRFVIDTHTHADHFSAARQLGEQLGAAVVMHRESAAPHATMRLDDGDMLQQRDRCAFIDMMEHLNLNAPAHITEALRTNMSGGKTVAQLLSEAAAVVPFMSLAELRERIATHSLRLTVLDVREQMDFEKGHIPGARHLPRGQLELRVNNDLPDPTMRIVVCCEYGKISTLAAATLRQMGFAHVVALDGGMKAWRDIGYPLER